ncbi:hypothetical protein GCM10010497_15250 [Streptomyces cinereoruber]|uniref:Uncharacterized protein n=1 Tax=Streptomyces cinereoruber TaxID=67260 RepID=A0AAV4KDA6_9ACTN|nr:hypothetical protein GCM10010497_15250 [Streptomyces cinereoruber]
MPDRSDRAASPTPEGERSGRPVMRTSRFGRAVPQWTPPEELWAYHLSFGGSPRDGRGCAVWPCNR